MRGLNRIELDWFDTNRNNQIGFMYVSENIFSYRPIVARTMSKNTNACRWFPTVVVFPLESATLPKPPPKIDWVSLYVNGLTTNRKMNAENTEILHFLELEGVDGDGDDIVFLYNTNILFIYVVQTTCSLFFCK
jgi:hypothetical protein